VAALRSKSQPVKRAQCLLAGVRRRLGCKGSGTHRKDTFVRHQSDGAPDPSLPSLRNPRTLPLSSTLNTASHNKSKPTVEQQTSSWGKRWSDALLPSSSKSLCLHHCLSELVDSFLLPRHGSLVALQQNARSLDTLSSSSLPYQSD
jgi:hypothetical protein